MITIVTRSGQITLDSRIRRELEIDVGTPLEVNRFGDMIVIEKKRKDFWKERESILPENFEKTLKELRKDSTKRYKRLKLI